LTLSFLQAHWLAATKGTKGGKSDSWHHSAKNVVTIFNAVLA